MFDRFLGRQATTDDFDDDVMARFVVWRRQTVSAGTVNRDLGSLLALWRWAHRTGQVARWPQVELEKVPNRTPIAWTQDEFNLLLSTAKQSRGFVGCVQASDWWTALLLTLFDTGERINAVLLLSWSAVQLDSGWVRFPAEARKGQREDSLAKIHEDTCQAITKLRGKCRERVFDWPYTRNYIWKLYGDLLTQAGLPNDRSRKFHCVRKTTASYVEAAGGNATNALRHSSRKTTLAYLDPRIVQPAQATDFLWRPE
jgi:integrase